MKKLLIALLLGLSLVSCETDSLTTYEVKYIPEQNIINYNGNWIQNLDLNGNSLNDLYIKPNIGENSILVYSKNGISSITLYHIPGRFVKINNNSYKINFTENNYLQNNYNQEINIDLTTN